MTASDIMADLDRAMGDRVRCTDKPGTVFEVKTERDNLLSVLNWLKQQGFAHLSFISCVDWIAAGELELVYHLGSYTHKLHVLVKIRIDRDRPWAHTVHELWGQAQVYEQEIHEFFGAYFPGNPDLSPLFLHNWQDMPPLRKDFDATAYSMKAYTLKGLGFEEGEVE